MKNSIALKSSNDQSKKKKKICMKLEFMKLEFHLKRHLGLPECSYRYGAIKLKKKNLKKTYMEIEFMELEFHLKCHYRSP